MLLNRPKNIDVARIAAEEYIKVNYTIYGELTFENVNGVCVINCDGHVEAQNDKMEKLTNGFEWGEVKGNFNCSRCKNLRTLEGAPEKVGRDFYCYCCTGLKSLEGAPKEVGEDFYCASCNGLVSLEGAPETVGGDFICMDCKGLKSLEGAPEKVGGNLIAPIVEISISLKLKEH